MLLDHEKAFHTITRRCQWKLLASMKLIQTWFKSNIFSNFRKLFLFLWSFWCSLPEDYVIRTAWKVSKYGFFSGPHFLVFGLNTAICRVNLRTEKKSVFGHFSRSVVLSSSLVLLMSIASKFSESRLFSGTYFLVFGTRNIHIQSEYGKIRTRKTFESVHILYNNHVPNYQIKSVWYANGW